MTGRTNVLKALLVTAALSLTIGIPVAASAAETPCAGAGDKPLIVQSGVASWYHSTHGRKASHGHMIKASHGLTAAHKTLPFGTKIHVTDKETGKSVEVVIDDRGPYIRGRVLDLSSAAAQRLGIKHDGVAKVTVQVFEHEQSAEVRQALAVRRGTTPPQRAARVVPVSASAKDTKMLKQTSFDPSSGTLSVKPRNR